MSLLIRHLTPGLGLLPRDAAADACSGLIGVAIGTSQAQAEADHKTQVFGWNPNPGPSRWHIGSVEARATRGWNWAKLGGYDFRVTGPLISMSSRAALPDSLHAYTDPHLLLPPASGSRYLHYQTPVPDKPGRTYTSLVNRADAVICCSEFIRDQFVSRIDYPSERVFEVNNGIRLERFENLHRDRFRSEWSVDPSKPVILFAGALVPEKGLLHLLRAASQLQSAYDFEIAVAGSSDLWITHENSDQRSSRTYLDQLRDVASGMPIRWLGSVSINDMPDTYAAADICVVPSVWDEPFGLVACEAMATGRPVVASRRGGLSQIVVDGETGLHVPSEDHDALRGALETLLRDPDLRVRMGDNARTRSQQFSWTRAARQLEAIRSSISEMQRMPRSNASEARNE